MQPIAHQRTVISIIGRLLLAATAYYIWDEHNKRVFKQVKRSWVDIRDIIITTVRLKLFTLKFKNKERVIKLLAEWKMPKNFRLYGEEIACDSSGQNPKKDSLSKSQDESDDDSEEEEYPLHDFTRISSTGGRFSLEDDDLDCYDGYEPQVYNLSGKS
ncbi:hypothetical protein Tco_0648140 [Tanacetum coccineum]